MTTNIRRTYCILGILSVFICMLQGCAPKAKLPEIDVTYYPQCYAPFTSLSTYQERMQKRRVIYVTSGAVTGAAVGVFAGVATAGWQGALAGGIVGGILGASAGFTLAKIEEIKEDDKRLASYRLLIGDDLANATAIEIAAMQSLKCYVQEFERLREALANQKITREDFSRHYAEIRAGMKELGKITGDAKTLMTQREIDMRASLQKEISRSQSLSEKLPSVDERRFLRQQRQHRANHRSNHRSYPKKSSRRIPAEGLYSNIELSAVKSELNRLETEIKQDITRHDEHRVEALRKQAMQSSSEKSNSNFNVASVTHNELITVYDEYPDKVLQLEIIEEQRVRTLQIMEEAASKTGIDMV